MGGGEDPTVGDDTATATNTGINQKDSLVWDLRDINEGSSYDPAGFIRKVIIFFTDITASAS